MNCMLQVRKSGSYIHKESLNKLLNMYDDYFYYYEIARSENYPIIGFLYLYTYEDYNSGYDINTHFTYLNDYVNVPIAARNLTAYRLDVSATTLYLHDDKKYNISIPFNVVNTRNNDFDEFCRNFNTKSTNDLYVMLQNINENIKKTNDFLTDKNIDNSNVNTPSQPSQNDPTSSGFDNIFNSFKSAFTDSSSSEISITIPFANRSFYLTSDFLSRYLKDVKFFGNVGFLDFIHMFWLFVFSLYIVKDVEKIVEKIKSGDIATSSDTNIKTEML